MKQDVIIQRLQAKQASIANFAGNKLIVDASGTLIWPAKNLLVVSDLHFEKGSFLGAFANPIPHYDSHKTVQNLSEVIGYYSPQHVLCLGDSFHDNNAWLRLSQSERIEMINLVNAQTKWTWILGNHDPDLPNELPGDKAAELLIDNLLFLHEPNPDKPQNSAQVFGHFHPKMTKILARHRMTGRCFMHDQTRMVLPSFGAYTGGLSIDDSAFDGILKTRIANKHLIYQGKIYSL